MEPVGSVNLLFVCSMNQWRSPTAEKIYADRSHVTARSCGTARQARRRANVADIRWADVILAMEQKHKQRLLAEYPAEMRYKRVWVLDIPDDYRFMDPKLIEELKASVDPILAQVLN